MKHFELNVYYDVQPLESILSYAIKCHQMGIRKVIQGSKKSYILISQYGASRKQGIRKNQEVKNSNWLMTRLLRFQNV